MNKMQMLLCMLKTFACLSNSKEKFQIFFSIVLNKIDFYGNLNLIQHEQSMF